MRDCTCSQVVTVGWNQISRMERGHVASSRSIVQVRSGKVLLYCRNTMTKQCQDKDFSEEHVLSVTLTHSNLVSSNGRRCHTLCCRYPGGCVGQWHALPDPHPSSFACSHLHRESIPAPLPVPTAAWDLCTAGALLGLRPVLLKGEPSRCAAEAAPDCRSRTER